ncbi:glycosyltransferase family 4 protein [Methylomagnum ishizawai]|uniref:glycosyltransferase family 4 protein n=1 Tax=Methylomagnum ishizawai TaxID=1760988 RepID=UPI001C332A40|nr:glycosyltransferase family 1 protein [Methylomagnum ishizawai]BBL73237.1 glycosyl transferase [Methylomagnum ishizawai]
MKIALISDAWRPQINGVVTTLTKTCQMLGGLGHVVEPITPDRFKTWPCPSYPEIRLALCGDAKLAKLLDGFKPEAIHIATEGPLGMAGRKYCLEHGLPFTTSFHTRFPEYVNLRLRVPLEWSYGYMRWFHGAARRTMVATPSLMSELKARGFENPVLWSRGVDADLFSPDAAIHLEERRPIFLYAGRVAVEKGIEDFLRLDLPGTKYVVGDGPQREELARQFPEARFVGYKTGRELAGYIAAADVFVFPSRTDTFGLVLLEALACGVPVAAYPVQGPSDVLTDAKVGCLSEDLRSAALGALSLDRGDCRRFALGFSWDRCARQFLSNLQPF